MAGGHGGKRAGAGRRKGTKDRATVERAEAVAEVAAKMGLAESDLQPRDFMLAVMRNPELPLHVRLDAASKAARYCHPTLATVESHVTVEKRDATDWTDAELERILTESRSRSHGAGTAQPTNGSTKPGGVH